MCRTSRSEHVTGPARGLTKVAVMGARRGDGMALDYTLIAEKIFQSGNDTREEGELFAVDRTAAAADELFGLYHVPSSSLCRLLVMSLFDSQGSQSHRH